MICVSLGNISPEIGLQICKEVKMVELRADLLKWSLNDYEKIIKAGVRTIMTCRTGPYDDQERIEIVEFAAKSGVSYIDIELESDDHFRQKILEIKSNYNTDLIISYHNYDHTPEKQELEMIIDECYIKSADVAKIACRVYSSSDVARLLSLYERTGRKVIIGMGNAGKISRLAGMMLGAEFTFASVTDETKTAEGQIDYRTMNKIYDLLT